MNQENAYSKGCKVKYLLKSKTSTVLVDVLVPMNQYDPKKSISKLSMQSLKGFPSSIPMVLDAATP